MLHSALIVSHRGRSSTATGSKARPVKQGEQVKAAAKKRKREATSAAFKAAGEYIRELRESASSTTLAPSAPVGGAASEVDIPINENSDDRVFTATGVQKSQV